MAMLKLIQTNPGPQASADALLMQRVALQDVDAYCALVDRYGEQCLRVAQRLLRRREDAEDVVQGVWMKLWREAPQWQPTAKLSTWLYRVVVNAAIDHQRKHQRFVIGDFTLWPDSRPGVEDQMMEDEQVLRVRKALDRLPVKQRTALVLNYYEELSGPEVARIMDMTLGAVQVLLHRARKTLQQALED